MTHPRWAHLPALPVDNVPLTACPSDFATFCPESLLSNDGFFPFDFSKPLDSAAIGSLDLGDSDSRDLPGVESIKDEPPDPLAALDPQPPFASYAWKPTAQAMPSPNTMLDGAWASHESSFTSNPSSSYATSRQPSSWLPDGPSEAAPRFARTSVLARASSSYREHPSPFSHWPPPARDERGKPRYVPVASPSAADLPSTQRSKGSFAFEEMAITPAPDAFELAHPPPTSHQPMAPMQSGGAYPLSPAATAASGSLLLTPSTTGISLFPPLQVSVTPRSGCPPRAKSSASCTAPRVPLGPSHTPPTFEPSGSRPTSARKRDAPSPQGRRAEALAAPRARSAADLYTGCPQRLLRTLSGEPFETTVATIGPIGDRELHERARPPALAPLLTSLEPIKGGRAADPAQPVDRWPHPGAQMLRPPSRTGARAARMACGGASGAGQGRGTHGSAAGRGAVALGSNSTLQPARMQGSSFRAASAQGVTSRVAPHALVSQRLPDAPGPAASLRNEQHWSHTTSAASTDATAWLAALRTNPLVASAWVDDPPPRSSARSVSATPLDDSSWRKGTSPQAPQLLAVPRLSPPLARRSPGPLGVPTRAPLLEPGEAPRSPSFSRTSPRRDAWS